MNNDGSTMSLRHLSMSQLAEVTGLDRRTVKDRLKNVEPFGKHGKAILFDAPAVLPILLGTSTITDSQIERQLLEESLRLETAKADKTSLEVEKLKGEVVATSEVAQLVASEYTRVRSRLMSLPSRCAMDLALESNPSLVKSRLDEEVTEALTELTADAIYEENTYVDVNQTIETDSTENSKATTKT